MAATNKPRARPKASANGRANGNGHRALNALNIPVLELTSAEPPEDEERIPVFTIDGTEYTVPAVPSGHIGLNAQHLWATQSPAAATDWVMTEMLGAEGYAALLACRSLSRSQLRKLVASLTEHAMGTDDEDDPKDR